MADSVAVEEAEEKRLRAAKASSTAVQFRENMHGKVPITVVTGFLGSGKTTLLRYILESKEHGKRVAVVENEFATELGVKNELRDSMAHAACVAELFETSSGCLCCSGSQEFKKIMNALAKHRDRFDYVVIETTGLVDPLFVQTFFLEPDLAEAFYLDGIVTLVDAKHIGAQLDRPISAAQASDPSNRIRQVLNEAAEQIAIADRLILNKTDLVSPADVDAIEARLRLLNPLATVQRSSFSRVPLDTVLEIKAFDLEEVLRRDEGFLDFRPYRTHDRAIQSLSLCGPGRYDPEMVREWLQELLGSEVGARIFRSKGVFGVEGSTDRYIFQGVQNIVDIEAFRTQDRSDTENRFVFIGMDLDVKSIRLTYKSHFPAGPKLKVEAFSGLQSDEFESQAESIAPYVSLYILVLLFLYHRGLLTLDTWSGTGMVAVLLSFIAVALVITGILRPRKNF